MYTSIRKYKTNSTEMFIGRVKEGFVPIISNEKGFLEYFLIETGKNELTAITIFDSKDGADASNRIAADWVLKNISTLITNLEITQGQIIVHKNHLVKAA